LVLGDAPYNSQLAKISRDMISSVEALMSVSPKIVQMQIVIAVFTD